DLSNLKRDTASLEAVSQKLHLSGRVKAGRLMRVAIWIAVLIGIAVPTNYLLHRQTRQIATSSPGQITMAVLPFKVLTVEEQYKYLSLGIPDAIITRLANIKQIRLRPTSMILKYENQQVDLNEVGRTLNVDHVVSGTVQNLGDRFRVSVQLIRVN